MKHASTASLALSIIVASIIGAWVSHRNTTASHIRTLLTSPSTIDQLAGIEKIKYESFDALVEKLTPLLSGDQKVTTRASEVLVQRAFADSCVEDLSAIKIDPALYDAALWWNSKKSAVPLSQNHCAIACELNAAPWLRRLASLRCDSLHDECAAELEAMPLRDRDGSILLSTLALYKHSNLLRLASWNTSLDIDQRKVFRLLQGFANEEIELSDSDPSIQNITTIINDKNESLAWRTIHKRGGVIDPDIFLAGLIADREQFLQILLETARFQQWNHPEHAVELARVFAPEIVRYLPESLLVTPETRKQWWERFACGLMLEKR